jgi:biopolymer transport protein ExbD
LTGVDPLALEDQGSGLVDTDDEVLVALPRRHRVDEDEIDITPMIDITFLLLIFFLVASRLQQNVMAELPLARYGDGVSTKTAVILTVIHGPGETDLVFRGDTTNAENRIDAPDLQQQEALIAAYVEEQFKGVPPDITPKEHVILKAGRDVRSREVARVARAAARADTAEEIKLYVAVREAEK